MEVYHENMTLNQASAALVEHLEEHARISVDEGKLSVELVSDREVSFYFTELVRLILMKVARADTDIVKLALDYEIELFETKKPKIPLTGKPQL